MGVVHLASRASMLLLAGVLVAGAGTWRVESVAAAVTVRPANRPPTDSAPPPTRAGMDDAIARLPLSFEENHGQFAAPVHFAARGADGTCFVTDNALVFGQLVETAASTEPGERGALLVSGSMEFAGADGKSRFRPEAPLPGKVSYLIGNDREKWHTGVPTWRSLRRSDAWPGIDLVVTSRGRRPEYLLELEPGADIAAVSLRFPGARGTAIASGGHLVVGFDGATMTQSRPVAWQEIGGERRSVRASFHLRGGVRVGFILGDHDPAHPVTIDPVVEFGTFLGGLSHEEVRGLQFDSQGRLVCTGFTLSTDFPTTPGVMQPTGTLVNAYVTRLATDLSAIQASTYFGGSQSDFALGMDVDPADRPVVVGWTESDDFPVANAWSSVRRGLRDAFVSVLDEDLSGVHYSTFVGSSSHEEALSVDVDSGDGALVIAGWTRSQSPGLESTPFPGAGTGLTNGDEKVFYLRIDPSGLGAATLEVARVFRVFDTRCFATGIAIESDSDDVYIAGFCPLAPSADLTGVGFDLTRSGVSEGFVIRVDAAGDLLGNTLVSGTLDEDVRAIAIGPSGDVYVCGRSDSGDLPIADPLFEKRGNGDAYLIAFSPDLAAMTFGTYLGGDSYDEALSLHVSGGDRVQMVGVTNVVSGSQLPMPATGAGAVTAVAGGLDSFIAIFDVPGRTLEFLSHIGGSGSNDRAQSVAVHASGRIAIGGVTNSTNLPLVSPVSATLGGGTDGFLVVLAGEPEEPEEPEEPQPATLALDSISGMVLVRMRLTNPPAPIVAKDAMTISGTFAPEADGPEIDFDPAVDEFAISMGPMEQRFHLVIPAGDPRWKRKGSKLTWKGTSGGRWSVSIDSLRSEWEVKVTHITLNAVGWSRGQHGTEEVTVDLRLGEHEGSRSDPWLSASGANGNKHWGLLLAWRFF